jgi:deoxyribodipyrimidine photolyase
MLRIYGPDSRGLVVTTSAFRNAETQPQQRRDGNKRRPSCPLGSAALKQAQKSCEATSTAEVRLIHQRLQSGAFVDAEDVILRALRSFAPETGPVFDKQRALAAGARIRELSKGLTLGGLTIRELIDEGRP